MEVSCAVVICQLTKQMAGAFYTWCKEYISQAKASYTSLKLHLDVHLGGTLVPQCLTKDCFVWWMDYTRALLYTHTHICRLEDWFCLQYFKSVFYFIYLSFSKGAESPGFGPLRRPAGSQGSQRGHCRMDSARLFFILSLNHSSLSPFFFSHFDSLSLYSWCPDTVLSFVSFYPTNVRTYVLS